MSAPILHASSLTKHFGAQPVLNALDWQVRPGQVIGLLGRNGAGKSTLLECLLGLRESDGGTVTAFGEAVGDLSSATRARIGYVPQASDLFAWMTARQMLAYFEALYPRWNGERVAQLLARWGFDGLMCGKPISKLSGGEKQRLSIIRALAHDPELLVLAACATWLLPASALLVLAACATWLLPASALQYAALSGRFDNATWCVLGAVSLLAGAAWARHCWVRMVKAPAAFPAGRLLA
ncbi:ATP-binding cassette domain-containing protein [Massilia sp. CCM 8733]|uniref:ATP-binding cassette domain-containing protein n=1 Tax=Massilia mucilaginosa TaxID=2609282 RepID=A0ABX0NMS0_9BURK|nr:ABC transporter ATP-binding protein [Massilia mucilaginosa]NHZ88077.1 ATP-binding cassette domain-containing protein [Massilia mucilaginosa]